jgi:hypothetical protein
MISFILFLLCSEFVARCLGGAPLDYWTYPQYNEFITNGSTYGVAWSTNLLTTFPVWCSDCDITNLDLCLQSLSVETDWLAIASTCPRFHDRLLANKIPGGIDISRSTQYNWDVEIDVGPGYLEYTDFVLNFSPS